MGISTNAESQKRPTFVKLEIHCMIGRKDKFTSNDQNTNCFFGKPKNSLTGENVKFFVFVREMRRNPISTKNTKC